MKTTGNIKLATVEQLHRELKQYDEKRWDDSVVAWIQDDLTFGVVGMGKDKDGDLRIEVEEVEDKLEGIWPVTDVITSLESNDKDTRVYLAGHGLYFAIDGEGHIFTEDDDVIGCHATVVGEYEPELQPESAKKRENPAETIVLALLSLAAALWLIYNVYAMIAGVGGPLWEKILWIIGSGAVLVVCGFTLHYSKK